MPATLTLKETFAKDGYVILEDIFSLEEVKAGKEDIRRILEREKEKRDEAGNKSRDTGVFVGITLNSPLFKSMNAKPALVEALTECFAPNLEFWSDKVVYKSAAVDFGSPWHQDWMYWKGAHKLSVWIALDDANKENGCLRIIPGSHVTQVKHAGEDKEGIGFWNRLRPEDIDESKAIDLPCRAGTAVVFHDLLLHASYRNMSGKDRWALISTYRDAAADDYTYEFAKAAFMVSGKQTGKSLGTQK